MPLRPERYRPIIGHCIISTIPTFLGFPMVIFLVIPALMPPVLGLDLGSSISSLNISTSPVTARWNISLSIENPSKLIAVEYANVKLLLSFGGELRLSRPSRIPAFAQGPRNLTMVRAEALSTLPFANDLGVKGLVRSLPGGEVIIDVVLEAKLRLHLGPWWVLRLLLGPWWVPVLDVYLKGGAVTKDVVAQAKLRLHLGPWWVPVLDVYFSCMGVTFTAPNCSDGGGDWMILGGTPHCEPDIFSLRMEASCGSLTRGCDIDLSIGKQVDKQMQCGVP